MASERRVLVVGATGILRPAALALVAAGDTVVAVARSRVDLTALEADGGRRVEVVPLDVTRPASVLDAVKPGRTLAVGLDAAIVYAPRPPSTEFAALLARVDGPVVRILTSAAAEPRRDDGPDPLTWAWTHGRRPPGELRLLLGWIVAGGVSRWHTPEEVSAAALEVLAGGGDAVAGRVRPWGDRPD